MLGRAVPQTVVSMVQGVPRIPSGWGGGWLRAQRGSPVLWLSIPSSLGRNEPLKKERPKWKSDYPMTDGQLRSKRDEFWDTAPAFEGRKEIWDALKAAAYAVEANDHSLAQAILDGASITLPHGKGQHLGEQVAWVLSAPRMGSWCPRLERKGVPTCHPYSSAQPRRARQALPHCWGGPVPIWVVHGDAHLQHLTLLSPGSLTECYDELGNRYQLPVYCLAPPVNLILERSEEEAAEPAEPLPNARREFALKVRLSTGKDLRLSASMGDTIGQLKKQLQAQEGIDSAWQRWFFSGKLLTDRTRLQETKIQKDFVVQVIVNQPLPPRN